MQPTDIDESELAKEVIESYWENRRLHEDVDKVKEKSIKFVHQDQFEEDTENERTSKGLPSLVVDKTFSVWKTLDGYARRNKVDIKFTPVAGDDYDGAKLHNKIFTHIRNHKELHHYQSMAYGMAAITDESYLVINPVWNAMGQLEPDYSVPDTFECYPDANFKDPIGMDDAEFIDLPSFMHPRRIEREYEDFMTPGFKEKLEEYSPHQAYDHELARQTYKNRQGEGIAEVNGLLLINKRFYKKHFKRNFLLNLLDQSVEEIHEEEKELITREMMDNLGFDKIKIDVEELWLCITVPDVTEDHFLMNEKADFQPINPHRLGKVRWPVVRYVFTHVAGKAIGAIRGVVKIQEARNLILSALLHHLQTAANGGMLRERGAFGGDEKEEWKFDNIRNRAGYTGVVQEGALKDKRIMPVPRGEMAFRDAGDWLESILMDVIKDVSGAEPVMKGQAQKGAPASLFQMQVEQSQNQLLSSAEFFRQSQNMTAEITYSFTRQFYTEQRILQIEGVVGQPSEALELNRRTAQGYLNDPAHGLFAVYKSIAPVTETARRKSLADAMDIAAVLANIGMPAFVQDFTNIVENLEAAPEHKVAMLKKIEQWQMLQGIGEQAAQDQAQAQAQQSQIKNREALMPTALKTPA
jgi:hypothetical protein